MVQYWREEIAWMGVLQSGPQVDMDRLKFTYGLDVASSLCGIENPGSLLDVGAGTGTFVRIAKEAGWKTTALEFNIASAESLEREGYRVIVKPLELADLPPASFDLITLWEILEHVAEPQLILRNVSKLLTPSGILLILVPNAGSLVTRILHEKSNTFGGHSHLNHFNVTSLKYLLETNGFEILETETLLTELGTINNYLDYQDPYLGDAKPFFDSLTPEIIHDRLWGSRLLVLSKKKEASKPNEDDFHDSPDSFDPSF
jgi:2-polyprenyl-3-methyl-5-hydroxy-6-metoxy-1,4-benzoquinol methylase